MKKSPNPGKTVNPSSPTQSEDGKQSPRTPIVDFSKIAADLANISDSDSDEFDLPSWNVEDTKKKKKKKKKGKSNQKSLSLSAGNTPTSASSRLKTSKKKHTIGGTPRGMVTRSPRNLRPSSPRGKPSSPRGKPSSPRGKRKGKKKKKNLSKNVNIRISGKSKKRFEIIYNKYEQGGLKLGAFIQCVQDIGMIDNEELTLKDIPGLFNEAVGNKSAANLDIFLQALALSALKRYPDGINDDRSAALERLLDEIEEQEDEETNRERRRAVYQAKKRAAMRAKAALESQSERESETDLEKDDLAERKRREDIAKQRAYLRIKAKIRAEKEAEEMQKKKEEQEKADAEEKELVLAKLRAEALKKAMSRTKQRLLEYRKEEEEALANQRLLISESQTSNEESNSDQIDAVQRAEERVKFALKCRKKMERLEKEQEEQERHAEKVLQATKAKMSAESLNQAMERTRKRLKAKLAAEKKELEKQENQRREKQLRDQIIVREATARAEGRLKTKKIKLDLDEATVKDLHAMFEPFSMKGVIHKPRWAELIQKYRLCDGLKMKKGDIDVIYSKSIKKGVRGLEFKSFCKAIAALGNKRFPEKKNHDPNDAIERVLQATIRKNDAGEMKQRKAELRKKKKLFKAKQAEVERQKKMDEMKEAEQKQKDRERNMQIRANHIKEQLARLEKDKKEQEERARKREIKIRQREEKERIEKEKQKEEELKQMAEKQIKAEKLRREAEKRTKARLKEFAKKEEEDAERKKIKQAERDLRNLKAVQEGQKRAQERVMERKKLEVRLRKEDTNNLQTLYDHYTSGSAFTRADWLNCTTTLGLLDGTVVKKSDLDKIFESVVPPGTHGINSKQFCSAMGLVAQRTHPGEEHNKVDNEPTKCLERLLFEIMSSGGDDEALLMDFDPTLDDSYLEGLEETEEEKAERLQEEKEEKKKKRERKKKREKEARLRIEEEERVRLEKLKVQNEKVRQARAKAKARVAKRKSERFTISEKDSENLKVLYEYFKIHPIGMSRADWLNSLNTLGIQDGEVIQKTDCEQVFEDICNSQKRGITLDEFGIGLSLLAMRKYSKMNLTQTKALVRLMGELMDGGGQE